jgi:hypothetical protein
MKLNSDTDGVNKLAWSSALLLFVAFSAFKTFSLHGGMLFDSFHLGEYFSSFLSVLHTQGQSQILVIHGTLDYLPALLAREISGPESYFITTWFFYQAATFMTGLFILASAYKLLDRAPGSTWLLLAAAAAVPYLVGYRELFAVLALLLFLQVQEKHSGKVDAAWQITLGLSLAFGLFWSFDRGIAAATAFGAGMLLLAGRSRSCRLAIVVFGLSLALADLFLPTFSLRAYSTNITFLVDTSSQWRYPWTFKKLALVTALGVIHLSALALMWTSLWRSRRPNHYATAIAFSIFCVVIFKGCANRMDMPHFYSGLWAPGLVFCYWYGQLRKNVTPVVFPWRMLMFPLPRQAPYLLAVMVTLVVLFSARRGDYDWVHSIADKKQNVSVVAKPVSQVAAKLRDAGVSCVFDLSNHGLITGLVGVPACTRFTYLVYANEQMEDEIIAAVESRQPSAVIYSSTHWSYSIDKKSMRERLPRLDKYLLQAYPTQECSPEYCLRFRKSKNG